METLSDLNSTKVLFFLIITLTISMLIAAPKEERKAVIKEWSFVLIVLFGGLAAFLYMIKIIPQFIPVNVFAMLSFPILLIVIGWKNYRLYKEKQTKVLIFNAVLFVFAIAFVLYDRFSNNG